MLDMTLINGRFHGDPHPGNLLCLPGNRIAMLDLGLIGHVSPRRREEVIAFTQSIANSDPALLAETLKQWSQTDDIVPERFQAVADRLVARHGGGALRLAAILGDIFPVLREERIVLQPDMLLLFKALITIDGVLSGIQPDFDLSAALRRASARSSRRVSPPNAGPGGPQRWCWSSTGWATTSPPDPRDHSQAGERAVGPFHQ
ncbi:hypothetical protein GCM10020258_40510 [Sphingomonas yabuuchiae]